MATTHVRQQHSERGLTLIEMLATMLILIFILLAAYRVIDTSQRISVHQTEIANMDSDARTTMDLMASEIREAALNPTGQDKLKLNPASVDWISVRSAAMMGRSVDLRSDIDGNGDTLGDNEYVRYEWRDPVVDNKSQIVRWTDTDGDGTLDNEDLMAEFVSKVVDGASTVPIFAYFDPSGNEITDDTKVINAASVQVAFRVHTKHPDRVSRKVREITMEQTVNLRNVRRLQ